MPKRPRSQALSGAARTANVRGVAGVVNHRPVGLIVLKPVIISTLRGLRVAVTATARQVPRRRIVDITAAIVCGRLLLGAERGSGAGEFDDAVGGVGRPARAYQRDRADQDDHRHGSEQDPPPAARSACHRRLWDIGLGGRVLRSLSVAHARRPPGVLVRVCEGALQQHWAQLSRYLDRRQLIEFCMLATQYDAFGATLAALKLPLDVWE